MVDDFYTNIQVYGSKIFYRGVENGRRVKKKIEYHPTLFVASPKPSKYTAITGEYLESIQPGTIRDCRDFVKQYEDAVNFKIYGMQRYEYAFISEYFKKPIRKNKKDVVVANIDIECESENGFPHPETASEPLTAITVKIGEQFIAFGCGEYENKRTDVRYIKCANEIDLIKRFLDVWSLDYPDIVTGWNVKFFDIPYLVNRITNILGESWAKKLSPWNVLSERRVVIMGREQQSFTPMGIAVLDYMELYRKFAPNGTSQESYKLDHICFVELKERKIQYEGSLHRLYKEDYQKFITYNIRDVELVENLDNKLKLINLALILAYDSKTNYEDAFAQTRMWDSLIYNHLIEKNIVIPPVERKSKPEAYIGAYVKDPKIGLHKWVASFDLNSLYPHLIMEFNISPEMFIEPSDYTEEIHNILSQNITVDGLLDQKFNLSTLRNENVTLTPNGQFFRTHKQGFLAKMLEDMYNDRSAYKKKALEAKKELEHEKNPEKRREIENRIAEFDILQMVKKVCSNSCYGAIGSEFFRLFDVRQASAITTAGQLAIRWIEKALNKYLNKILQTENEDYVIASDTDSIYLCLDRLVCKTFSEDDQRDTRKIIAFLDKVCEVKLQPFIDKNYQALASYLNAFAQKMIMKREVLADRGIWTAKKRYILNVYNSEGVEYEKPKVKVMGLEVKKSSTPSFFRTKMEECINIILNSDENSLIEYIGKVKEEMKTVPPADIAFPRGVNGLQKFEDKKNIYSKGCPIHVRGSLIYNHLIKQHKLDKNYPVINEGEKIKFIYLKEPNIFHSNIIAFPEVLPKELKADSCIDYNVQFDKAFLGPIKIITDSINWKTEHVSSLEEFFS